MILYIFFIRLIILQGRRVMCLLPPHYSIALSTSGGHIAAGSECYLEKFTLAAWCIGMLSWASLCFLEAFFVALISLWRDATYVFTVGGSRVFDSGHELALLLSTIRCLGFLLCSLQFAPNCVYGDLGCLSVGTSKRALPLS